MKGPFRSNSETFGAKFTARRTYGQGWIRTTGRSCARCEPGPGPRIRVGRTPRGSRPTAGPPALVMSARARQGSPGAPCPGQFELVVARPSLFGVCEPIMWWLLESGEFERPPAARTPSGRPGTILTTEHQSDAVGRKIGLPFRCRSDTTEVVRTQFVGRSWGNRIGQLAIFFVGFDFELHTSVLSC